MIGQYITFCPVIDERGKIYSMRFYGGHGPPYFLLEAAWQEDLERFLEGRQEFLLSPA